MSNRNTEPITTEIDPMMDTGRAAREAVRLLRQEMAHLQKIDVNVEDLRQRAEAWDRAHGKNHGVMIQIWAWFKGWLSHGAETAKKIRIDE
jgi:hypothetical protein